MPSASIIEKIRKMVALSKGEGNEAETAAKMALKWMLKYGISEDDIADSETETDKIVRKVVSCPATSWVRSLYNVIAQHCGCKFAYTTGLSTGALYGFSHDTEIAEYIFDIAYREIKKSAKAYKSQLPESYDRGTKIQKGNEFKYSAVLGLRDKLKAIRSDMESEFDAQNTDGDSYAVIMQTKAQELRRWLSANASFSRGRGRGYQNNAAGYTAGKSIRINRGVGATIPKSRRIG